MSLHDEYEIFEAIDASGFDKGGVDRKELLSLALQNERDRIREELLRFVSEVAFRIDENSPDKVIAEHMRAEIRRICPEED